MCCIFFFFVIQLGCKSFKITPDFSWRFFIFDMCWWFFHESSSLSLSSFITEIESKFALYSFRMKILEDQPDGWWGSCLIHSFIHWSLVLWILFCLSNSPKENLSCTSFACNLGWKNFKTPMDGFQFIYLFGFTLFIYLLFDHCFMILLLKSFHSTMDKSSSSLGVNRGGTVGEPGFSRLDLLWEGIHPGWTSTHPCNTEKIPKSI